MLSKPARNRPRSRRIIQSIDRLIVPSGLGAGGPLRLSATRIGEPTRRDRLLLVSAFAISLLTMLGAVGEGFGMDRLLKSNRAKTARIHCSVGAACSTN